MANFCQKLASYRVGTNICIQCMSIIIKTWKHIYGLVYWLWEIRETKFDTIGKGVHSKRLQGFHYIIHPSNGFGGICHQRPVSHCSPTEFAPYIGFHIWRTDDWRIALQGLIQIQVKNPNKQHKKQKRVTFICTACTAIWLESRVVRLIFLVMSKFITNVKTLYTSNLSICDYDWLLRYVKDCTIRLNKFCKIL